MSSQHFNEESYLPACLKSLSSQTYPKDQFEIIVADNNSTDTTVTLAKDLTTKSVTEQQGHVFTLNTGMKNATGHIIAVTDADTIVAPNWLEIIADIFQDPDVAAVTGSNIYNIVQKP